MFRESYEKNKMSIAVISIIAGLLFIAFVIRPSILGYSVYKEIKDTNYTIKDYGEDIQELKSELLISDTNLSSCSAFNKELLTGLEKFSDKFSECKGELSALEVNFDFSKDAYEKNIKNLENELKEKNKAIGELKDKKDEELTELGDEKEEEINDLKLKYEFFVENTANNICCKAKVDNHDINFYKIENDKIVCLEEGTLDIEC